MIRRRRQGHVEVVELDSPPLNLLGRELVARLREALHDVAASRPRAVLVNCTGGGADVRELVTLDQASARTFITDLHSACAALRSIDAPVVGFADGPCLGAHLELAASCDLRACTPRSRLGMPEVRVGVPSVIDACWLLALCGLGRAAELVFSGEPLDAPEAARLGLVNRVVADAAQAEAWAGALAARSPVALAMQKRVLRDWTEAWYRRAVDSSVERFAQTFASPEAHEAMRAFLDKRPPRFGED